jgi:hypothetical protein
MGIRGFRRRASIQKFRQIKMLVRRVPHRLYTLRSSVNSHADHSLLQVWLCA